MPALRQRLRLLTALLAAAPLAAAGAQTVRPLSIDEALGTLAINLRMPVDLSPDGEWVAYTVYDARRRESPGDERFVDFSRTGAFSEALGCEVWITNTRTGETRKLTAGRGTSSNPVWSPDGKYLAFFSDQGGVYQLWLWERATGTARQISDAIARPFFGFAGVRWSADSRRLVLKALPAGMTVAQAAEMFAAAPKATVQREPGSTVLVYEARPPVPSATPSPDSGTGKPTTSPRLLARYMADIAVVDVPSGTVHRVATGVHPLGYWISPDGRHVAFTNHVGFLPNTQQGVFALAVTSVGDAKPRVLVPDLMQEYGISVSWSPDGRTLAYTTFGQLVKNGEAYVLPVAQCLASTAGECQPRLVSRGEHPNFGHPYRAPLWNPEATHLYFVSRGALWRVPLGDGAPEEVARIPGREITEVVARGNNVGRLFATEGGRAAFVSTRDPVTKRVGFARVDLAARRAAPLFERDQYFSDGLWTFDVSDDGRQVIWVAQDAQHAEDIWVARPDFRNPGRLTRLNPQLDSLAFGASRIVSWATASGDTLRGALLLPSNYESGKRYPLIVKVYAGSTLSNGAFRFGASGAGVENLQMFATRGYAVLLPDVTQRLGTPMADIAAAVLPAVDTVIALGIADPERLGVTGHSYGGYSTLSLIVQTDRFKAAMSSAGPANLVAGYGAMATDGSAFSIGWSETGQGLMGGTPWEFRERYIENSPFMFLDRVKTPLLIVHGAMDRAVPAWHADAVFVGLRRLGREVVLAKYEGEEHWQGTWGLANATDYWKRVLAWFDAHLKQAS